MCLLSEKAKVTNNLKQKIVIGTWALSGDFGKIKSKDAEDVINYAISKGFSEFDTAPVYGGGKVEKILSKICKNNNFIKINTKCGYSADLKKKTFRSNDIIKSVNKSIELYGKINILYLHNPRNEIKNWYKLIELLNKLKSQKKIKYTGISLAHDFDYDEKILNEFDCVQNEFNLLRQRTKLNLNKMNNTIYARSPFASGILSSKFDLNKNFLSGDHRKKWLTKERLINICNQKNEIEKLCNNKIENYALKFVLNSPFYKKVIVGIKKKNHVDFIFKSYFNKKIKITKKFSSSLDSLFENNFNLSKNLNLY